MKVYQWIILLISFSIFTGFTGSGQPVFQKYFPKVAPSVIMFKDAGIPDFYLQYYRESFGWPEIKRLRGSIVPFYQIDYYYDSIMGSVVTLSLMNVTINQASFNASRINMGYLQSSVLLPLALPVIYKKASVRKLVVNDTNLLPPFIGLEALVIKEPEHLKTIFSNNYYTYEQLIKRVYYENPRLVDIHIEKLPDLPKLRHGTSSEHRASRERLAEMFQQKSPELPDKLTKVDEHKRPWIFSGSENIQLSQAYLKNWAKGGQNSVALLSDLRIKAIYEEGKIQWENSAIHKLGFISSQSSLSRVNDDLIDLNSKYGINASKNWFYSFLFNFKTQFFNGYSSSDALKETPISSFMAPGYFTLAAGMDFKKGKNFTLMISPVTSKFTIVADTAKVDQTRYNIPEDKRSEFLTGGSLINNFIWQINKEMKFTSAANVFYDYFNTENKVQAEWDMILDMRINVFLSTRITTNFRYFENESSKLQVRENLSISFRYNF